MKAVRVLQVASFAGNIGDNANHLGFRGKLAANLPEVDWRFSELEIRGFYRGDWQFDDAFADLANSHDLLIIGGGNYFELWVKGSATGTSIDMSRKVLERIRVPILFNGLGVDPAQGATEENLDRFRAFLDYLRDRDQFLVSVRNDGSRAAIEEYVGNSYLDFIHHVPDAGHFVRDLTGEGCGEGGSAIAVNLAGDMLETRFPPPGADYSAFLSEITAVLSNLLESFSGRHVVFVPHIFRDLKPTYEVMDGMDDALRRERVSVAPCTQGDAGALQALGIYSAAALTLGMRFHANVCPIGLDIPTIGLDSYRQIREYYREMQRPDWAVDVRQRGFSGELLRLAADMLDDPDRFHNQNREALEQLNRSIDAFHGTVGEWLGAAAGSPLHTGQ